MIQKPAFILFDLDGTLADSYRSLVQTHIHTLKTLGFDQPQGDDWYRGYFGCAREEIFNALYPGKQDEAHRVFINYIQKHASDWVRPYPGADDLLQFLKSQNIPAAIVTNKRADLARAEIAQFAWMPYLKTLICAGDAVQDKPSAAPLLLALEQSGYTGAMQDVWMVGDTESDLKAAQNAGCQAIYIRNNAPRSLQLDQYSVLETCNDVKDLKIILQNVA